jgi:hypothetical protein
MALSRFTPDIGSARTAHRASHPAVCLRKSKTIHEFVHGLQRCADDAEGSREIAQHELSGAAHEAKAKAPELQLTALVSERLTRAIVAIHFNDQLERRRTEISDEPAHDDLAAERPAPLLIHS